ncbi:MAG: peptidoglycan DD-metalloendopeptidase family protein [Gammaproteobacteria bacterium]|nr:peptidoglycan DD-metalloendopeptidase family protein [Gammaproteobacteria bacterium]MDH3536735.1 peptidoglycan DD-metalloendopeptidase family protein [Gammaproteobacteria bacterium]
MKAVVAVVIALMMLASCVVVNPPTRVTRSAGWYTVKTSDTLYSIAWRYGLDYHQLAQWNQIDISDPIHPGQRLRLVRPANQAVAAAPEERTGTTAKSATTASASNRSGESEGRDPQQWLWPTVGEPLNTFLASRLDRRGIDIAGKLGQPVRAVADGKVVYSGNGLAGYGNLIIIKHSEKYLSAYAYCRERLVQEGAAVKAGNIVAEMGRWDNTAKLHFEIRRNGQPVDPMKYLPDQ